ncbi:hypothetical protein KQX54_007995 [Cotesia glomerata]|uniref:Uncharacterized protein n=1 Tax=Cotesia glomerata TaxID=32391 RepID=A0AAV7IQV6_COTGL|nr:hypothetical protein KQX54_007995 [Cotesia glomerata]
MKFWAGQYVIVWSVRILTKVRSRKLSGRCTTLMQRCITIIADLNHDEYPRTCVKIWKNMQEVRITFTLCETIQSWQFTDLAYEDISENINTSIVNTLKSIYVHECAFVSSVKLEVIINGE